MPHILKNENLEIHIDLPNENYNFSRFDWTGKIVSVKFRNIELASVERIDNANSPLFGKGFCNEFGIETALGFEDANIGSWFHKIGVGLLKKEDDEYLFHKNYTIIPATFKIFPTSNKLKINCESALQNGYSYFLKKEISLSNNGFIIKYSLKNTGEKVINTTEYTHNFTSINKEFIDANYELNFPFHLNPTLFNETVNPEKKVVIEKDSICFNSAPKEEFFFSNLSGSKMVEAKWELINHQQKIGICETGNFQTNSINLWGCEHVISPELFYPISIKPEESTEWTRTYNIFKVN